MLSTHASVGVLKEVQRGSLMCLCTFSITCVVQSSSAGELAHAYARILFAVLSSSTSVLCCIAVAAQHLVLQDPSGCHALADIHVCQCGLDEVTL